MRIGFRPECRLRESAMSCVFPQPAGAVTDPQWTSSRSISATDAPPSKSDDRVFEFLVTSGQVRPDDLAADLLHLADRLEPGFFPLLVAACCTSQRVPCLLAKFTLLQ